MRKRTVLLTLVAATILVLATSAISSRATVNYPDVDGCAAGCTVAAAGWPFPYLVDYPGISPAGSVSLTEAAFGSDHVLWTSFVASWLAWAVPVVLLVWLLGRRRKPQKRRRL